jgi:phage shock protein A
MALLERVTTLIRANINDLVDRAEDPEKMIKQVILDMQNQLIQLKTQVAISIADEHMLEKRMKENGDKAKEWFSKAEIAVDKKKDDLARGALERHKSYDRLAKNFEEQVQDQKLQVDNLKSALRKLEQKLAEAQSKADLLIAQHRRSRAASRASDVAMAMDSNSKVAAFERLKDKVIHAEAVSHAKAEVMTDALEDQFEELSKGDEIEKMLAEIKSRRLPA